MPGSFEGLHVVVDGLRQDERLGRPAPHGDQPSAAALALEGADVVAHLLDHVRLGRRRLDVGAMQALDVSRVEDALHRTNGLKLGLHGLDVSALQHLGVLRGLEGVIRKDVPPAELQLPEARQRNEVGDLRRALVRPFAEPNGPQLGERPDGNGLALARQHDPRDGGGCHGAHAGKEDAELSFGGLERCRLLHGHPSFGPIHATRCMLRTDCPSSTERWTAPCRQCLARGQAEIA
jgi:hypothetical protein